MPLNPPAAWTPEQLALMQPGARLDIAGPWIIRVFIRNAQTQNAFLQSSDEGSRSEISFAEKISNMILLGQMNLGVIDMGIVLAVPKNWTPGDTLQYPVEL